MKKTTIAILLLLAISSPLLALDDPFVNSGNGIIVDTKTGLVWQSKSLPAWLTIEEAQQAIDYLGDGWRIPTKSELYYYITKIKYLNPGKSLRYPNTPFRPGESYMTQLMAYDPKSGQVSVFNTVKGQWQKDTSRAFLVPVRNQ